MESYTKRYIKKPLYVLFLLPTICLSDDDKILSLVAPHLEFIENIIENYTLLRFLPSRIHEDHNMQIFHERNMMQNYEQYLRHTNAGFLPITHETQISLAHILLTLLLNTKGRYHEGITQFLIAKKIHPISLRITIFFFHRELQGINCYLFKDQDEIDAFFEKSILVMRKLNEYCNSVLTRNMVDYYYRFPHLSVNPFKNLSTSMPSNS